MRFILVFSLGCLLAVPCIAAGPDCTAPPGAPYAQPPWDAARAGRRGPAPRPSAAVATATAVAESVSSPVKVRHVPRTSRGDAWPRPGPEQPTPREGPTGPSEEYVTRESGFFQAPPRSAPARASRSIGVNFGASPCPNEVPHAVHRTPVLLPFTASGRHALVEAADAPWVSTGLEKFASAERQQVPSAARHVRRPRRPRSRPTRVRGRPSPAVLRKPTARAKREYEAKLRELQQKIDDCENLRKCIEDCLHTYPAAGDEARRRSARQRPGQRRPPDSPASASDRRQDRIPAAQRPASGQLRSVAHASRNLRPCFACRSFPRNRIACPGRERAGKRGQDMKTRRDDFPAPVFLPAPDFLGAVAQQRPFCAHSRNDASTRGPVRHCRTT